MRVHVLFFGVLKEIAGAETATLDLPENACLRDVIAYCAAQNPRLKESLSSLAIAVNQNYAAPETTLTEGDEIALLPPVSGGKDDGAGNAEAGNCYVRITRGRIDNSSIVKELKRPDDGAEVVFEGIVRNHTRGRKTLYLDYEAYEEMALRQMKNLAVQSMQQFHVRDVALVHRLGRLEIGETSVLIVVASAHRAAAFDACRWLIDTLKRTVPIWKKEYFEDGAVWADGEPFPVEIRRANS